jgi:hypothetical protein
VIDAILEFKDKPIPMILNTEGRPSKSDGEQDDATRCILVVKRSVRT